MLHPFYARCFMLLLLPLLVACAKQQSTTSAALGSGDLRWQNFPVAIQMDQNLAAQDGADADIQAAIHFWEEKAGKQLFLYQSGDNWAPANNLAPYAGDPSNPTSIFANVMSLTSDASIFASGGDVAGKTVVMSSDNNISGAEIYLNGTMQLCGGTCMDTDGVPEQGVSRQALMAHELGHFLGLGHNNSDTQNIMYPSIQGGIQLENHTYDQTVFQQVTD